MLGLANARQRLDMCARMKKRNVGRSCRGRIDVTRTAKQFHNVESRTRHEMVTIERGRMTFEDTHEREKKPEEFIDEPFSAPVLA